MHIADILTHRVGRPLIPVARLVGLLGGKDLHEALAEGIELVGVGDMAMKADRKELRENVDPIAAAVDAIANGNVNEPILAGNGNGGLASKHGQGKKAGAATAAENEAEYCALHEKPGCKGWGCQVVVFTGWYCTICLLRKENSKK